MAEERARGEQLYVDRYTINLTIIHLGQSAQPYTSHESFIQLRKTQFLGRRRASQAEEKACPRVDGRLSGREKSEQTAKRQLFVTNGPIGVRNQPDW